MLSIQGHLKSAGPVDLKTSLLKLYISYKLLYSAGRARSCVRECIRVISPGVVNDS